MKGMACGDNKVQPQNGNWQPDWAGWCPGMEVPVRTNVFDYARAGESFCYKYQLEPWENDMGAIPAFLARKYTVMSLPLAPV